MRFSVYPLSMEAMALCNLIVMQILILVSGSLSSRDK